MIRRRKALILGSAILVVLAVAGFVLIQGQKSITIDPSMADSHAATIWRQSGAAIGDDETTAKDAVLKAAHQGNDTIVLIGDWPTKKGLGPNMFETQYLFGDRSLLTIYSEKPVDGGGRKVWGVSAEWDRE